jgi:hypothetical protein
MEVRLYSDEWQAIRNNIPEDSAAHDRLPRAVVTETNNQLEPNLKISCDEDATKVIIQAAKPCCPERCHA